jgi:hypothetical protein
LRRACLAYAGKTSQLLELRREIGGDGVLIVEYDEMLDDCHDVLTRVYNFIGVEYRPAYGELVDPTGISNRRRMSRRAKATVESICGEVYKRGLALCKS